MVVLISILANTHAVSLFPFIHRRHAASFLFPVSIDDESAATVWFFSNADCFLVGSVIFGLWVELMIESCHSVWVSSVDESIHAFFLEAADDGIWGRIVVKGDWIGCFEFDCIALIFECTIWRATHAYSFAMLTPLSALKEIRKCGIFLIV